MTYQLTLPRELDAFVGRMVANGRFATPEQAVIAAVEEFASRDAAIDSIVRESGLTGVALRADLESAWADSCAGRSTDGPKAMRALAQRLGLPGRP